MIDNGRVTWAFAAWLWLQSHGKPMKTSDVEARIRCGERNARRVLNQLHEVGLVERGGKHPRNTWQAVSVKSALAVVLTAAGRS